MNKMTTVEQNENALKILREYGIEPNVGFIMFEPESSLQDVRANFEFLRRNDLLKNLPITANVLYHHQIVLKGTPAYRELTARGTLNTASSGDYEGTASFTSKEVQALTTVMRGITNIIFNRMSDIWSGRVLESVGAQERYSAVNRLVVETFENVLRELESGTRLSGDEMDSVVKSSGKEIDRILNGIATPVLHWQLTMPEDLGASAKE